LPPELHQKLTQWRRHLHAHPELGLHEKATSAFVQEKLTELGIPFEAGIGGHGVVATLTRGAAQGRVGLRADMDALPITEDTGLPYASTTSGVMHACGHDGHTASLLGAAALLVADTSWSGTVDFIFQPAEEGLGGARAMVGAGLFDRFPMTRVFGFHNWPGLAAGTSWVFRDESAHMAFAFEVIATVRREEPHLFDDQWAGQVRSMIEEAVECEAQFADDVLSGGVVGLTRREMRQYLEYVADQRLTTLGLGRIYESRNPFAFLELQDVQELTNFFERRVSAYQTAVQGEISFDAAF